MNIHVKCQRPSTYQSKNIARLKFSTSRLNTKVKVTRSFPLMPMERSFTRNTHVKYQSPSTYDSNVIAKVKVLEGMTVTE